MVIAPTLLHTLFTDTYEKVKLLTQDVNHGESIRRPYSGSACMHWIVGHIVVSRCNFLNMLGQPSIWDWSTCEYFIPGSIPTAAAADHISFEALIADLDRTQSQLASALVEQEAPDLSAVIDDRTLGEHLAIYATHEAYHAGQLEMVRLGLDR